ncbi:uncharacterized protein LOC119080638 [Bradysia coprophila]|uniref:uncharacterized protein LOC119080638 n=1 Tax=Bradysia coprophila TaxID=38358 RepID=UPI00187D9BF6|nr:uncharacterized protein LOC119080638 [Bradysia coprophila]
MDMLTKIVTTILLAIISVKMCRSGYAASKLTVAQPYPSYNIIEPDGPGTYAFGYEIDDVATGNKQFRNEERLRNGTVQGSYGSVLPDGTISITKYVADENGYRSKIINKNPRPMTSENILDNHQRPSSSAEISPDVAAMILSQKRPIKPIQPTKMEVKPQPVLPTPQPSLSNHKNVFGFNFPNFFEPQSNPPASSKPMNQPIQTINDRFHSPIYESKTQENAAFFQNSKLHKFFHSPHYIQNIYGKYVMNPEINDDQMVDDMFVTDEEPIVGMASPLTKEAIWYKDHVNNKRVRNANSVFMRDY